MFGGYYLGQIYLGESGTLIQSNVLIIQDTTHSILSDNVDILQYHKLSINNTIHSLSSDNVLLTQLHYLLVNNTIHSLSSDKILKIFNWDDMHKYFGIYLKDYSDVGEFNELSTPDKSIYILETKNLGSLSSVDVDESGI